MSKYTPIIGLEIHVELKTLSKMFCSCKNDPDETTPNKNICEICLAHPGCLPVPNAKAIKYAVIIAKALNCRITEDSKFDRKNYFYPDLPKGYQISQYDQPIGEYGFIELNFKPGENHRDQAKIGVTRVHLEEDTAKLSHNCHPEFISGSLMQKTNSDGKILKQVQNDKANSTLVDFNRGGIPLVEIVSEPDIQSSTEAKTYCQELQLIFRSLEVSDADMEKGHMRCEANISVQETGKFINEKGIIKPIGNYELNNKVELKNINSFGNMAKGVEFEIKRQIELIEKGETWNQQTRGWDEKNQETIWQRDKETSADYRYFPEPDIPPFNPLQIAGDINLGELPQSKRQRFIGEFGFSPSDAYILTANKYWADYTENVMSELNGWVQDLSKEKDNEDATIEKLNTKKELAKLSGGWLTSKLMGLMSERKIDIRILKIKPENFAELIALIYTNRINSTNALKVLIEMLDSGTDKDPTHIMEDRGYGQVSDENEIGKIIDEVIINYPEQVAKFKAGKEPLIKFLIGMAMKASEGSADPVVVEKLLREKLQ